MIREDLPGRDLELTEDEVQLVARLVTAAMTGRLKARDLLPSRAKLLNAEQRGHEWRRILGRLRAELVDDTLLEQIRDLNAVDDAFPSGNFVLGLAEKIRGNRRAAADAFRAQLLHPSGFHRDECGLFLEELAAEDR